MKGVNHLEFSCIFFQLCIYKISLNFFPTFLAVIVCVIVCVRIVLGEWRGYIYLIYLSIYLDICVCIAVPQRK